jgi:antiphage defense system Thoeris ThsA-like protein
VLASAVTAVVRARPRNAVVRSIPPTDVTVAIRVGDVLKQSGNVIVGTNDTLDTQSEAEVISRASVQGQLLERVFSGDRDELDRQIDASICDVTGVEDTHKQFGKTARYPIGTVAVVRFGGARYFLPAFARMSATLPAHGQATIEDLQVALASTWKAINAGGQREPVHAPIVGSHLARLGVSRTLLAQMLILSFIAATRSGGASSLTVWVAPQDRDIVDMVVLDEWLRGLCAV